MNRLCWIRHLHSPIFLSQELRIILDSSVYPTPHIRSISKFFMLHFIIYSKYKYLSPLPPLQSWSKSAWATMIASCLVSAFILAPYNLFPKEQLMLSFWKYKPPHIINFAQNLPMSLNKIKYKLLTIICKAFHGPTSSYLVDTCIHLAPVCSFCSASLASLLLFKHAKYVPLQGLSVCCSPCLEHSSPDTFLIIYSGFYSIITLSEAASPNTVSKIACCPSFPTSAFHYFIAYITIWLYIYY